jgi:hypothetical protein
MKDHPCILRARQLDRRIYPNGLRRDWVFYLRIHGMVKFKGSYAACQIAKDAFSTKPYTIRNASGQLVNKNA